MKRKRVWVFLLIFTSVAWLALSSQDAIPGPLGFDHFVGLLVVVAAVAFLVDRALLLVRSRK